MMSRILYIRLSITLTALMFALAGCSKSGGGGSQPNRQTRPRAQGPAGSWNGGGVHPQGSAPTVVQPNGNPKINKGTPGDSSTGDSTDGISAAELNNVTVTDGGAPAQQVAAASGAGINPTAGVVVQNSQVQNGQPQQGQPTQQIQPMQQVQQSNLPQSNVPPEYTPQHFHSPYFEPWAPKGNPLPAPAPVQAAAQSRADSQPAARLAVQPPMVKKSIAKFRKQKSNSQLAQLRTVRVTARRESLPKAKANQTAAVAKQNKVKQNKAKQKTKRIAKSRKPSRHIRKSKTRAAVAQIAPRVGDFPNWILQYSTLTNVEQQDVQAVGQLKPGQINDKYAATGVTDTHYNTEFISTRTDKYLPSSLTVKLEADTACDEAQFNPCIAFEKDSVSGQTKYAGFYVITQRDRVTGDGFRFVRIDVPKSKMQDVAAFLNGRRDGLYVVSFASLPGNDTSEVTAVPAPATENSASTAQPVTAPPAISPDVVVSAPMPLLNPSLDTVRYYVKQFETPNPLQQPAALTACSLHAIMDPTSAYANGGHHFQARRADGTMVPSYVSRPNTPNHYNAEVDCDLRDGKTLQRVPVIVEDFPHRAFHFGGVTSYRLYASGGGYANGAEDIIKAQDYDYSYNVNGGALFGSLGLSTFRSQVNPAESRKWGFVIKGRWSLNILRFEKERSGFFRITMDPHFVQNSN